MRKHPEFKPFLDTVEPFELKINNRRLSLKIEVKTIQEENYLEVGYCLRFFKITEKGMKIKEIFELITYRKTNEAVNQVPIRRLDLQNLKEVLLEVREELNNAYNKEKAQKYLFEFCEQIFLLIDKLRRFHEINFEFIKNDYKIILNLIEEYKILNDSQIKELKEWLNLQGN